jgi:dihydrofolate synthase/folylpolyglutamate synthase
MSVNNPKLNNKYIDEIICILKPYIYPENQKRSLRTNFTQARELMQSLGSPQKNFKAIHIAGTSGKTSTAYYISSMLIQAGAKTGLSISPHVDNLTERIQVNGQPLKAGKFLVLLKRFMELLKSKDIDAPGYFVLLYCFSIWALAELQVEYAVIETGMGGTFDATNVIDRSDKICIITDIGYDHVQLLGPTIRDIARHKAGIIHKGNSVFMYRQNPVINEEINRRIVQVGAADIKFINSKIVNIPRVAEKLPLFQRRNWYLALKAYTFIADRDQLADLSPQQQAVTVGIYIPGRMDITHIGRKTLIIDGAHNEQKLRILAASVREQFRSEAISLIFSINNHKQTDNLGAVIDLFSPEKVILTAFNSDDYLRTKAADPAKLAASLQCNTKHHHEVVVINSYHKALAEALNSSPDVIVISGSFFLISQIRQQLNQQN